MFIELYPGGGGAPVAKRGLHDPDRRHAAGRQPRRDPRRSLDADTRDYLQLLVNGAGRRAEGPRRRPRASCSRASSRRTATSRASTARSRTRREQLRHLVSSLQPSTRARAPARRPRAARQLVVGACSTRSPPRTGQHLRAPCTSCRATLRQTTDDARRASTPFAEQLGPTTRAACARPSRALAAANEAVRPFAREATPIVRDQIRPFVREARPLVRDLRPAVDAAAAKATPNLTQAFAALQPLRQHARLQPERPEGRQGRPPGGLPVLAGLAEPHGDARCSRTHDANGAFRPCS